MASTKQQKHGRDFFCGPDDEAGIPWDNFMIALQVWSWMQPGDAPPTVRDAADAFHVTDQVIRDAVRHHHWMLLTGPDDDATKQRIEHDGD